MIRENVYTVINKIAVMNLSNGSSKSNVRVSNAGISDEIINNFRYKLTLTTNRQVLSGISVLFLIFTNDAIFDY